MFLSRSGSSVAGLQRSSTADFSNERSREKPAGRNSPSNSRYPPLRLLLQASRRLLSYNHANCRSILYAYNHGPVVRDHGGSASRTGESFSTYFFYNSSRIQLSVAFTILFETDTIWVSCFASCYRLRLLNPLPSGKSEKSVESRDARLRVWR